MILLITDDCLAWNPIVDKIFGVADVPQHPDNLPADAVSQILDYAFFSRSGRNDYDGAVTFYFELRKPLPGLPAGSVVSLAVLHNALFGKPLPK